MKKLTLVSLAFVFMLFGIVLVACTNNDPTHKFEDPKITTVPVASGLVYGAPLSSSTLTGGVASFNGKSIDGTFAWEDSSIIPNVSNIGYNVKFTPEDITKFTPVTIPNVAITVTKATPTVIRNPVASPIEYGQSLSASTFSGFQTSVLGQFTWATPSHIPERNNDGFDVIFVPINSSNLNSVEIGKIDITVNIGPQSPLSVNQVLGKTKDDEPFQLGTTGGTGTGAVTYEVVSGPATVTSGGMLTILGAGNVVVRATKAGDNNYRPVTSASREITIGGADQDALVIGEVVGKVFGDTPFQLGLSGGSGTGNVYFELVSGPGTVTSGGLVTITGAGSIVVRVTKIGDIFYNPATGESTIAVGKANQSPLVVNAVAEILGPGLYLLGATGGSGTGGVTYELVSGDGTVTPNGQLTVLVAGDIVVRATRAGDNNFNPVTSADRTIIFGKTAQAPLVIDEIDNAITFGDEPLQLSVQGGSGTGAVSFILISGPATVSSDGLVTILGAGSIVVRAEKAGDDNYNAVASANLTIVVNKAEQVELIIDKVIGQAFTDYNPEEPFHFQLSTTGGSGTGNVTFALVRGPAIITFDGYVKVTGAGAIYVVASKEGDDNYYAYRIMFSYLIFIERGEQEALIIDAVTGKILGDAQFQLDATGGTGMGNITYELVSGQGEVTSDGWVTILGVGSIVVRATKDGDDNYHSVTSADLTIVIGKGDQEALAISEVKGKIFGDVPFQLETTGGSGTGEIFYILVGGPATVTTGGLVTVLGAGEIVVRATKAGDDNYLQEISLDRIIVVEKADQVPLAVNSVIGKTFGDAPFQLGTTGGSGTGAVYYFIISGPATTTVGGLVTILAAGDIVVGASKENDTNYYSTVSDGLVITVAAIQLSAPTNPVITLPNPSGNNFRLAWSGEISEFIKYIIEVNEVDITAGVSINNNATFDIGKFMTQPGAYTIRIKAVPAKPVYLDLFGHVGSGWVAATYTVAQPMSVPTGLSYSSGTRVLSWDVMDGRYGSSSYYYGTIGDRQFFGNGTSGSSRQEIDIGAIGLPAGTYQARVKTNGWVDGNTIYLGSDYCAPINVVIT